MDRRKFIGILAATAATLKTSLKKGLQDTSNKKPFPDTEEKRDLGQSSGRWSQVYNSQDEMIFQWLPTSDPKVKGRLWSDCGKGRISQG